MNPGFAPLRRLARSARRVGTFGSDVAHGWLADASWLATSSARPAPAHVPDAAPRYDHALAHVSNSARLLAWAAHRRRLNAATLARPFEADATRRWLFLSVDDPICRSQVFPFFYYRPELRERFGVHMRELPLAQFEAAPERAPANADTVCIQTWFDRSPESLRTLLRQVREHNPNARIVYLDWFAPTDLRLAETLHGEVDLYIKKHAFRERAHYGAATLGDTNLMDYYGRRYGLPHEPRLFHVPPGFFDRLLVGPSFATADYMLPVFLLGRPDARPRPIDLHARISAKGTPWYSRMRGEALEALHALQGVKLLSQPGVGRRAYLRELAASKLCFSPFGYGEVCWRDYEAAMCGSLLLKPDMSHVETYPDIFRAGETYVPLRWDLSDLQEKVRYYLARPQERARIATNAFETLQRYFREQRFLDHMHVIIEHVDSAHGQRVAFALA